MKCFSIVLVVIAASIGMVHSPAPTAPASQAQEKLPPIRTITRGPKFHWFGYYDKLQFDPSRQ
jgi:hypothetical protein